MDYSNVREKLFAEFPEFKQAASEMFSSTFDMESGDPKKCQAPISYLKTS